MNADKLPVWQMSVDEVKALIETNRQQADRIAELEKKQSIRLTLDRKTGGLVAMQTPQTKPLSDEEIDEISKHVWERPWLEIHRKFARAIEAKVKGEK